MFHGKIIAYKMFVDRDEKLIYPTGLS